MRESVWQSYELLDASSGERLERWGDVILIRPDPQVIWKTPKQSEFWDKADARYHRSKTGGGKWEVYNKIPDVWDIKYKELVFRVKPMGFKHTGIFPEQAVNWDFVNDVIEKSEKPFKVLNLFSYTGAATLACARAGASVCHVDSSKGMVSWARENAIASRLGDKPIRWIVDDCIKFVAREIRRGNKYDGIIMDPPSYGRGPNGEIWKLEDNLYDFINECSKLLHGKSSFFILNSYTTGLSPSVMGYILNDLIVKKYGGSVLCDEIGLRVSSTDLILPCGATSIWQK